MTFYPVEQNILNYEMKQQGYARFIDARVKVGDYPVVKAIASGNGYPPAAKAYAIPRVEQAVGRRLKALGVAAKFGGYSAEIACLDRIARQGWVPLEQRIQAVEAITKAIGEWVGCRLRDDDTILATVRALDAIANDKDVRKEVRAAALDGVIKVLEKWTAQRKQDAREMREKHRDFVRNAAIPDRKMNGKPLRY
jgi:hypothetical protein